MQQRDQHQRDRLGQVEGGPDSRVAEDLLRLAQVRVEVRAHPIRVAGQQGPGVRQHDRVVVHVDHPGFRRDALRDLVHVAGAGQAGADVQELPDPGLGGQVPHGPVEERPVLPGGGAHRGPGAQHLAGRLPVGREVVFPAQEVVVDPGGMRPGHVDSRRRRDRLAGWCGRPGIVSHGHSDPAGRIGRHYASSAQRTQPVRSW